MKVPAYLMGWFISQLWKCTSGTSLSVAQSRPSRWLAIISETLVANLGVV